MSNLSSENTGAVRTAVNATVIGAVVWGAERLTPDLDIDTTSPAFIAAVGVVVGIGYRASRELDKRFPVLGRILFGIKSDPRYTDDTAT